MNKFIILKDDEGRTLIKYLQRMFLNLPMSRIQRALRQKDIKINGEKVIDKSIILKLNDEVEISNLDLNFRPQPLASNVTKFEVIYEDNNIIVIDKPNNISMHGDFNSLDNQVLRYLNFKKSSSFIPASIGRLDKVTSGIIIYAKNYETLKQLTSKQNNFKKIYQFKSDLNYSKMVTLKLKHNEFLEKEEVSENDGKEAITNFIVENDVKTAELITGRKHQIRVTLSYLGFPIYGDQKYGGKKASRVYLHSYKVILDNLEDGLKYLNNKEFVSNPGWN